MLSWKSIKTFGKSQVAAFGGSVVDYSVMIFLTEYFGIHYFYSICIGGVFGAVVNYLINRYWAFKAREESHFSQLRKYIIVFIGQLVLKSTGTYGLTELLGFDYKLSRIFVDFLVAMGFNYTLQKYWVFKN